MHWEVKMECNKLIGIRLLTNYASLEGTFFESLITSTRLVPRFIALVPNPVPMDNWYSWCQVFAWDILLEKRLNMGDVPRKVCHLDTGSRIGATLSLYWHARYGGLFDISSIDMPLVPYTYTKLVHDMLHTI